jgi:UDP-2,3-diacylglucosamine pyrophosphatase LpxH
MAEAEIKELLQQSEEAGAYGRSPIRVSAAGAEVVVISDLHLAAGRMRDGRYSGTENFFADSSLRRFIHAILARLGSKPAILLVNGDVVDFLRITEYPTEDQEFLDWQALLHQLGIEKSLVELRNIIPKELKYGLKTDNYKSVWKLARCVQGHPQFFQALAEWMARGNRIIITKGNHDLEWYWREVRDCLRLLLAQKLESIFQKTTKVPLEDVLRQHILPGLLFVDDAMVIDETFYVEHGHRYDKYTNVVGDPVRVDAVRGTTELNIPFGSFLNRYILNQIELKYPYVDNVRPTTNLLPLLIRERFFVAMKLLFYHLPFMLLIIPKGYYSYMFKRVAVLAAAVGIPLLAALVYLLSAFPVFHFLQSLPTMQWPGGGVTKSFVAMGTSYLLSRLVAYLQLTEPSDLSEFARQKFAQHPEFRLATMGHTHNPNQFLENGRWFYNTGTWIPIVELSTAEVRADRTYTFLHFRRSLSGELLPAVVERWDDEAGRAEELLIISND